MTKYSYMYNEVSKEVTRKVVRTYPDEDTLTRGITANRNVTMLKNVATEIAQGKSEAHLLDIEEKWYTAVKSIFIDEKELLELNTPKETIEENTESISEEEQLAIDSRKTELSDSIAEYVAKRNMLEKLYPFLKGYRGEETTYTRPNPSEHAVCSVDNIKKLIAYERDASVRNSEDSIADLAKMVSFLFSIVTELWEAMPEEKKALIHEVKKYTIDYSVEQFKAIDTRGDRQLQAEGVALIDKLFSREVAIANIVDRLKA